MRSAASDFPPAIASQTVARTMADMDASEILGTRHLGEAAQRRSLDRTCWAQQKEV